MFQVNDVVVYSTQGVCRIVGTEDQRVDGVSRKYFVLKSESDKGATYYVPTWNDKALAKMRKVMTKEDVNALIDAMPHQKPTWIANDNERKETYKRTLTSGDHAAIISMIQAIYLHRQEREAEGKRLHMSDEHFLKEAEHLLHNEWQYVLNMDKEGLMAYIFQRLDIT